MDRRELLTVAGGLTLSTPLAGCVGESPSSDTDAEAESDDMSSELDLSEANVVGVEFEERDGAQQFDVTLHHDDDGEDGYANWWQVETTDGERLGRRELLHAHGTREFTRSETVSVPESVTRVVVRGHDQTHGYGGQAMVVDLTTDQTRAVRQGEERRAIE